MNERRFIPATLFAFWEQFDTGRQLLQLRHLDDIRKQVGRHYPVIHFTYYCIRLDLYHNTCLNLTWKQSNEKTENDKGSDLIT